MSTLSLENIIQKSYHGIVNGDLRQYCDKLSKIAAFILADIYEIYEANKDNTSVIELRMFLNIRDPIKHLVGILMKFNSGAVSIKHAILDEIRIIKNQEHLMMKKFTLLDVIDEEINIFKNESHRLRNPEAVAQAIIDKLTIYRIEGHLHQEAESALMMTEIKLTLTDIVRKVLDGEDLKDVLFIYYRTLDEKKRMANTQLDETLARLKVEMLQLIQCEFGEVHNHLGIMGEQIYNAATGISESEESLFHEPFHHQQLNSEKKYHQQHAVESRDMQSPNRFQHQSHFQTPQNTKRSSNMTPSIRSVKEHRQPKFISNPSYDPTDELFDM